jgi:hypothetical protein
MSGAPSKKPSGNSVKPFNLSLDTKEISGDRLLPFFIVKAVLESRIIPSSLGKV